MDQPPPLKPHDRDDRQLRMLVLSHYLVAISFLIVAGFALNAFVSIYRSRDFAEISDATLRGNLESIQQFEDIVVWATAGMTAFFGVLHALLTAWSGWCVRQRKWRTFSLIVALMNLLAIPFGTILGIFTLVVLARPETRALYSSTRAG